MRTLRDREELCTVLGVPFSDEQLDAITAPLEPAVIIAGAGTGKTTVMAARVVWLVGTGQVRPEEVLGLTFTRKAAAELAGRVASALENAGVLTGDDTEGAELILTYDSFAARLVSEFGLRIGLDTDPVMLTGASRYRLAARAVAAAPGPFQSISRLGHASIPERVLELDAQMQSHLVEPGDVVAFTRRAAASFDAAPLWRGKHTAAVSASLAALDERLELLTLVSDYQELKRGLGLVEYADQLRRAVQLARTAPAVGAAMRSRFKVVLLDEYQDTSAAQAILLRTLFSGDDPATGRGFPVMAVGDPHQAIYGWRGAAANNILDFPQLFPRTDGSPAPRLTLRTNRRSGQRILDVGNTVASSLDGGDGVKLVAPPSTPAGTVEAMRFGTQDEELDWLAGEVIQRRSEGTPWPDIAVLVRRNSTLADVFEAFRDRDIPTEIVGLGGLLHLPEVAPIVATLRILDDVAANPDVAAVLSGPRWRLGLADLEALGRRARDLVGDHRIAEAHGVLTDELAQVMTEADPAEVASLLDAVNNPGEATLSPSGRSRVTEFGRELAELRRHAHEPVVDLVRRIVSRLGLEVELLARDGGDTSQLARFITAISDYVDVDGDGSLSGLLAWLEAEDDHGVGLEQAVPSDEDSVKLLTIHRAKGLEWNTVFLPALGDGYFPAGDRGGIWPTRAASLPSPLRGDAQGIPQLEEYSKKGIDGFKADSKADHRASEDRLAYVALTRAKQVLVASMHAWPPGLKNQRKPSAYFTIIEQARTRAQVAQAQVPDTNPVPTTEISAHWPLQLDPSRVAERRVAADLVAEAGRLLDDGSTTEAHDEWVWQSGTAGPADAALLRGWDEDANLLIEQQSRRRARRVALPEGLSATALMAMHRDPSAFAQQLLRRMPRRPSAAATLGTRFHDWVQRRFDSTASFEELEPHRGAEPPGLTRLIQAFERGQFGQRSPRGVEVPFLLRWEDQVLRGRIDAVYDWDAQEFDHLVVDWKTSNQPADPLQLAVYRQAWAQAMGIDVARVGAGFYHVLADRLSLVEAPTSLIREALAVAEED
ncbi:ATP-dependent DNA helicase [Tessaracoccus antarcticus]|uniref:ATP-dependent DNA helicase n=1 Tax=Tessaracoccus antarcticus TaxID=2479848 RepID=UPI001314E2FB|nr:ATP-dependent DNA helicase [Tessaracoccus antarcticus]